MGCPKLRLNATICAAVLLAGCLLAPAITHGQPAVAPSPDDVRLGRIAKAIEREGYRVLGIGRVMNPGFFGGPDVPLWWVDTAAAYARPTSETASKQAMTAIGIMYDTLPDEVPAAIFSAGQIWTRYNIITQARRGDIATLLGALRAARSDQEKDAAFRTFYSNVRWRVYDIETRRYVDEKDFVNKNFGAPEPPAPPRPSPPPPQPPAPAPTPAAPAPTGVPSVRALSLTAESATSVWPGDHVSFRVGVGLTAPSSTPIEVTLGWRSQDGAFQYGTFHSIAPPSADFTVGGICLRVVAKRGSPPPNPGSATHVRVDVYGAVRVGSQTLITQTPIVVQAEGRAPLPEPPGAATPTPVRTPVQSSCKAVLSTE
jgi:hypothetical protein